MLVDVTSVFKGFSQPLSELIDDIHRRGWTVGKIQIKDGNYMAEGKNPHGEKLVATGNTDATAAANLLVKIMRREHMRAAATREKLGAWDPYPLEQLYSHIAQAYASAPVYDPKAAIAWMDLAQDFGRRAQIIKEQISIEYTNDPIPYASADELRDDVTKKRHITLTRAYSHHPVWSEAQMLDYRLVVDVLGHTIGGGDWGWHGSCLAFAQLAPLLSEETQKALFTELLGQAAFGQFYRQWGPQKISFLDKLIEKEQEKENKPGHYPVHPSQSVVPIAMPSVFGRTAAMTRTQLLKHKQELESRWPDQSQVHYELPDGWTIRKPGNYADVHRWGELMGNCWSVNNDSCSGPFNRHPYWPTHERDNDPVDYLTPEQRDQLLENLSSPVENHYARALHDPWGLPRVVWDEWYGPQDNNWMSNIYGRHNTNVDPKYDQMLQAYADQNGLKMGWGDAGEWDDPTDWEEGRTAAVIGVPKDPNDGWSSEVTPLPDNGYLWQRAEGVDPLDVENVRAAIQPLESGISNMHPQLVQQSVANALRMALLGSRQTPRAHAIHYQTLYDLPAGVDDPIAYQDALEQARDHWNIGQGYAPESHKQHWAQEQQFKQWVKAANPHLDDGEVNRLAKREMLHMLSEEEERVLAADQGEQMTAEQVEHEAFEGLRNRLKVLTKPNADQKVDFGDTHLYHEATHHADMYPPYLASRMRALAQIGRNSSALAEAAREDLLAHKGHGHHFRSTALSLGIPGLGPRQISNAWLHLAPQTSQLAPIDPYLSEILGHNYEDASNRDFFKHERELAAGRDAAGYGHIPLGAFATGLWDLRAGGPGWHPDRSPLKAYSPTPHHTVDWTTQIPQDAGWQAPYWWDSTQEARDQAGQDFDRSIGTNTPKDEIPFQRTAGAGEVSPWVTDPRTGQRLTGPPGTSLMQHLKGVFGHPSVTDVWDHPEYEVGKA